MSETSTPDPSSAEDGDPGSTSSPTPAADPAAGDSAPDAPDVAGDPNAQRAALEEGWRRTAAELANFRARCARDVKRARDQERSRVAAAWLPVIDNLERALEHAEPAADTDPMVEGVQAVRQQALSVLESLGFRQVDDTGQPFDPALHEAVSTVSDASAVPGTVARVLRPRYGEADSMLRPAAVVVATRSE
jgi:molecular chaperone GrpE